MADELEERLNSHARAFEGLMSLIPAKQYYRGHDSEAPRKKKQTAEERRNAKRAKLDPQNQKNAKQVLDENERKRKRELEADDTSDIGMEGAEQPREGLKLTGKKAKKLKVDVDSKNKGTAMGSTVDDTTEAKRANAKAEKRKEKAQKKKEKAERLQQKAQAKQARREAGTHDDSAVSVEDELDLISENDDDEGDMGKVDVSGILEDGKAEGQSTASPTPAPDSPASLVSAIPSASSSSSIVPPSTDEKPQIDQDTEAAKPAQTSEEPKLPPVDKEALKARLQARIDALRAARKADGLDGKPARNRQELIEARRQKEEQRKAAKKQQRKMAKEDEMKAKAEAELARLRGSGSPLDTPSVFSPRRDDSSYNFTFGNVAFQDGQQVNSSLSGLRDSKKRKGPSDPRTALEAAQKKRERLTGLDEEKRADIEEKDMWLNAKKRAQGEKVHDDAALLKKSLKRKEKSKSKSEKQWDDRIATVQKGKETKQKKREENLQKRREEKGSKGKKSKKPTKKPKRPGFEGSFKARS